MSKIVLSPQDGRVHDDIELREGERVVLGRGPQTKITDKKCSREHVALCAIAGEDRVVAEQIGPNPCCVSNAPGLTRLLEIGQSFTFNVCSDLPSPCLWFLSGKFSYALKRVPTPGVRANHSNTSMQSAVDPNFKTINSSGTSRASKRKATTLDGFFEVEPKIAGKMVLNSEPSPDSSAQGNEEAASLKLKSYQDKMRDVEKLQSKSSATAAGEHLNGAVWSLPYPYLHVYKSASLDIGTNCRIAAFDLDGTIIATASGKKWPQNKDDWVFLFPSIPARLQQLHRDGFVIVLFTNQYGISRGSFAIDDFKHKITAVLNKLGVPALVMAATGRDIYRKPAPGMWNYLCDKMAVNGINVKDSMFVGDAAGRSEGWAPKKKKDFACTDRLFAVNVGLVFHTPEEFFCSQSKAAFKLPAFCPAEALHQKTLLKPPDASLVALPGHHEVALLVGYPASGKSHFARQHMVPSGYVHVNRDSIGTWQKCVKLCDESLNEGKSVVVDNTNPDPTSREKFIAVAKKHSVACRCFVFDVSHEQAQHNERFREVTDPSHSHINDMVMNMYKSKFVMPQLSEGFSEIVHVNFVPSFLSAEQERLYGMYLV